MGVANDPWTATASNRIERRLRRPVVALVGGLAVIAVVTASVAAVMAPFVVAPPRTAVVPDQFGGTPPPASPSGVPSGLSDEPAAPDGDPPIIQVGASIPIVDGPVALGSVTVLQHRFEDDGAGGSRLLVEVRYRASQSFDVRPEAWLAVPLDGERSGWRTLDDRAGPRHWHARGRAVRDQLA